MADAPPAPNNASESITTTNGAPDHQDIQMKEEPLPEPTLQPSAAQTLPPSTTPALGAPQTPTARSSPHPSALPPVPPTQPNPHGAPTRVYLNQNVTPYLLEGMKYLAVYEPEKPLKWLSEFLERKSREVEGG